MPVMLFALSIAEAANPKVTAWEPPRTTPTKQVRDDVDGDAQSDLIVGDNELYRSASGTIIKLAGATRATIIGDIDGDNRADVLVETTTGPQVWLGGDAAKKWTWTSAPAAGASVRYVWGDLDGEGRADLVALEGQTARVWLDGVAIAAGKVEFDELPRFVHVTPDLNADGPGELFAVMADAGSMAHFHGVFGSKRSMNSRTTVMLTEGGFGATGFIRWGDVDGDGATELILIQDTGTAYTYARVGAAPPAQKLNVPADFYVKGCDAPLVGNLYGGAADELVTRCGDMIRIWSFEEGKMVETKAPAGTTMAPALVGVETLRRVPFVDAANLWILGAPDWSVKDATPVPRPQ